MTDAQPIWQALMSMLAVLAIVAGLRAAFWRVAALRRARRSVFRTARRIRAEQHGEILTGTLVRIPRMPARPRRLEGRLPRLTGRQLALAGSGTLLVAVLIAAAVLVAPWVRTNADRAAVHQTPAAPRAVEPVAAPARPRPLTVARHPVRKHKREHAARVSSSAPRLPSSPATSTTVAAAPSPQSPAPAPTAPAPGPAPIQSAPQPTSPPTGGAAPVPAPPASQ